MIRESASSWRVGRRALTTAMRTVVAEPGGLIVAGGLYLMVTTVLSGLWRAAAEAGGGSIVGYSATALVWYIASTEATTIAMPQRLIEDIGDDIGAGDVTVEMLRPTSVLLARVAEELGRILPRLAVCAVLGVAFCLLVGGAPINGWALLLAAPSLVLAVVTNLLAQFAFAGAAFWILDAKSTWFLYQKLVFVTGGMLLPLEVLPRSVEIVAKVLPFSSMAYAPGRLAAGNIEPHLLAIQLAWIGVFAVVAARVFANGERHLTEVGA